MWKLIESLKIGWFNKGLDGHIQWISEWSVGCMVDPPVDFLFNMERGHLMISVTAYNAVFFASSLMP